MSLGRCKSNKMIQYVALGDSLSLGIGTSMFAAGFSERYLYFAERALKKSIYLSNFAHSGATTEVVLRSTNVPFIAEKIQHAQLITITIGGTDLIQAAETFLQKKSKKAFVKALRQCKEDINKLFNRIKQLKQNDRHFIIRTANLYNPFPNMEEANYWVTHFNKHLENFSLDPHVKVADIYTVFKGKERSLLSKDHLHPNEEGYQQIAKAFNQLEYEPLSK